MWSRPCLLSLRRPDARHAPHWESDTCRSRSVQYASRKGRGKTSSHRSFEKTTNRPAFRGVRTFKDAAPDTKAAAQKSLAPLLSYINVRMRSLPPACTNVLQFLPFLVSWLGDGGQRRPRLVRPGPRRAGGHLVPLAGRLRGRPGVRRPRVISFPRPPAKGRSRGREGPRRQPRGGGHEAHAELPRLGPRRRVRDEALAAESSAGNGRDQSAGAARRVAAAVHGCRGTSERKRWRGAASSTSASSEKRSGGPSCGAF
jgi:hypothetical protein